MSELCQINLHISCTLKKSYVLLGDGKELWKKYAGKIINKNILHEVGIEYYTLMSPRVIRTIKLGGYS
jgi:hypothetical protein